jgi:hypothetical protein
MRLAAVRAAVVAAGVVASGLVVLSARGAPTVPQYLVWNRPNLWDVVTDPTSPFQFGPMAFGATPDGLVLGLYEPAGGPATYQVSGVASATGLAVSGTLRYPTDDPDARGRFGLKVTDTDRYEKFKGKFFLVGKKPFKFSGAYRRGPPESETGRADLRLLLFATRPQRHLGKKPITSIRRSDLPAKVAFVGIVQSEGPDLLPFGVARMKFTVSPATGVTLPLVWQLDRVDVPSPSYAPGDVSGQTWVEYAKMGALGRRKDRSAFAIQADLSAGVPIEVKSLRVRFEVESIAPGFSVGGQKDVKTGLPYSEVEIPILDDDA